MRGFLAVLPILVVAGCGETAESGNAAANMAAPSTGATATNAPAPTPAAAPERASSFTPINDKDCQQIEENEETGDWVGTCPGVGGYALEWSISDLRDDLEIIDGKKRSQLLQIPSIVANGAFDSLGSKAEWRGPAGGRPDVLVVRVHVANAEGKSDSGSLAVARLGAQPCLVAVVPPGPGQSDRARAIADGKLPDCLKA